VPLIGTGEPSQYAIWDRQKRGPPVQRFAPSKAGWEDAYANFTHMEPQHQPVRPPPRCPNCGSVNVRWISGVDKAATAALVGVFALGQMSKSYECLVCRYRW
jgi:hypothetical protein